VHALHAGSFRNQPYTVQPNFPFITYPGILNNCEACHVPGSYDFSNNTNNAQVAGMLWDTDAVGYYPNQSVTVPLTGSTTTVNDYLPALAPGAAYKFLPAPAGGSYISPWANITPAGTVTKTTTATTVGTVYSSNVPVIGVNPIPGAVTTANGVTTTGAISYYAGQWVPSGVSGAFTLQQPDPGRLVTSPITAACSACHDSQTDITHMVTTGGGVFYQPATSVPLAPMGEGAGTSQSGSTYPSLQSQETCLVCHGPGGAADIYAVHMNFSGANPGN
jgi:OmcA/MtrC family decaheme c-type cytochrome